MGLHKDFGPIVQYLLTQHQRMASVCRARNHHRGFFGAFWLAHVAGWVITEEVSDPEKR